MHLQSGSLWYGSGKFYQLHILLSFSSQIFTIIHYRRSIFYFKFPGKTYQFSGSSRTRRLKSTLGALGILGSGYVEGGKQQHTAVNQYSVILYIELCSAGVNTQYSTDIYTLNMALDESVTKLYLNKLCFWTPIFSEGNENVDTGDVWRRSWRQLSANKAGRGPDFKAWIGWRGRLVGCLTPATTAAAASVGCLICTDLPPYLWQLPLPLPRDIPSNSQHSRLTSSEPKCGVSVHPSER